MRGADNVVLMALRKSDYRTLSECAAGRRSVPGSKSTSWTRRRGSRRGCAQVVTKCRGRSLNRSASACPSAR